MTVDLLLIVLALICFLLAAFGVPSRVSWQPLGLALYMLTYIV